MSYEPKIYLGDKFLSAILSSHLFLLSFTRLSPKRLCNLVEIRVPLYYRTTNKNQAVLPAGGFDEMTHQVFKRKANGIGCLWI